MEYKFPINPKLDSKLWNIKELMICPECKGTGSDPEYDEINSKIYKIQIDLKRDEDDIFIMNCLKCKGDGYIDWIKNARSKEDSDCKRPLMKNIRETSIYFLYSCLLADEPYSSNFILNSSYSEDFYINFNIIFGSNPRIFFASIELVDRYLLPKDRRMLFMGLHRWNIMYGYTCTNCFKLIPTKYFRDKDKRVAELIAMTPEIEMDYWALYAEEASYPIFILCDECYFNLNSHQIENLKKGAFDSNNPYDFSVIHNHKLLDYLYDFYKDKYFDDCSSYLKMKI